MIIIAHRGNLDGPNPDKENHPDYIMTALKTGFDVEVDIWFVDNKFILGHDKPQYEVNERFLLNEKMWHHTKNIEAISILNRLKPNYSINCFYHNIDDCTLTSGGWIWTYPGKPVLCEEAIAVMPENVKNWDISKAAGVCTDFPRKYQ
jgi:hypothetical protein